MQHVIRPIQKKGAKFNRDNFHKQTVLAFAQPQILLNQTASIYQWGHITPLFQSPDWRLCGVKIHSCVCHSDSYSSGFTVKLTAQSSLDTNETDNDELAPNKFKY